MANITSLGLGSGIDAEGIIAKLMSLEQLPITQIQTEETGLKTQLSSYGTLQGLISAMQDKARALTSATLWGQTNVASGDSSVVTGSTESGTAPGSYAVTVEALAAGQTTTSTAFANADSTLSAGTLKIELGAWTVPPGGPPATGFTAKAGATPVTVTIGPGETSLTAIRDKINAANAGVTATIVNDANGARLSLRSKDTGAENGFRLTATETADDGNTAEGLSALGFDGTQASSPMTQNQWSANAKATINGIHVESASNTLSNVSDGLTMQLVKVSANPVQLTVTSNTDAVNTAVKDFVTAFNALAANIQTQTKYNATSKTGGPLQGDRTAINLQWALRGVINQPTSASTTFTRLSDLGIAMKEDGTLGIDTAKLSASMSNPTELRKMLATDTGETASSGFMTRFNGLASAVLDQDGSITTRQAGIQSSIDLKEKQIDAMTQRLTGTEARLRAQYQALDTKMATLSALSTYITQQFSSNSN
jgi:flagellar hook-associated protein 2